MASEKVNFDFGKPLHSFAEEMARTILQSGAETGEYRGMGGHGMGNHGGHGLHSQISIGLGDKTINIRKTY